MQHARRDVEIVDFTEAVWFFRELQVVERSGRSKQ
jgi:hypothetical protein